MKFFKFLNINHKSSTKGFTIIELLLYMGIFSLLLVILMELFTSILALHAESQSTSSVDQDGAAILARINYDVHNASVVKYPMPIGTTCTGTYPTCQLDLDDTTLYRLDTNGNLQLTSGITTDQLNSVETKVTSIKFTTFGNTVANAKPSIQLIITLESKTSRPGIGKERRTFQTTVATR